ncbi:MAG: hypothetical protein EOO80_17175 [Oxalobacteraceae bacterium]|nr:MAG: hypothetical protein EOO80_17175 [Oxalobacteraceae bacterium]
MAGFEIHRATKRRAKLRLGMSGPAGSGKTYSALLIAGGLGGRIGMIDTEHGSGDLYADLLPDGTRSSPNAYKGLGEAIGRGRPKVPPLVGIPPH